MRHIRQLSAPTVATAIPSKCWTLTVLTGRCPPAPSGNGQAFSFSAAQPPQRFALCQTVKYEMRCSPHTAVLYILGQSRALNLRANGSRFWAYPCLSRSSSSKGPTTSKKDSKRAACAGPSPSPDAIKSNISRPNFFLARLICFFNFLSRIRVLTPFATLFPFSLMRAVTSIRTPRCCRPHLHGSDLRRSDGRLQGGALFLKELFVGADELIRCRKWNTPPGESSDLFDNCFAGKRPEE